MKQNIHATIAVTGGAGYIGSRLVIRLLDAGYRVIVIDDLSNGNKSNVDVRAIFYQTDIRDKAIREIFQKEKPTYLFHLAASKSVNKSMDNPAEFHDINVTGSANVFAAAHNAGIKRVIFTSSAGVYGDMLNNLKQKETDKLNPSSIYAQTKLDAENELKSYINKGTECIVLRFANVYGPGGKTDSRGVVEIFTKQLLQNKPITLHGTGMQTRDFIYTDDLIFLCMLLMSVDYQNIKVSPVFNVSTGIAVSVRQILDTIARTLGVTPKIIHAKDIFVGQTNSCLDPQLAESILQWRSTTTLQEGIKNTIKSLQVIQ